MQAVVTALQRLVGSGQLPRALLDHAAQDQRLLEDRVAEQGKKDAHGGGSDDLADQNRRADPAAARGDAEYPVPVGNIEAKIVRLDQRA